MTSGVAFMPLTVGLHRFGRKSGSKSSERAGHPLTVFACDLFKVDPGPVSSFAVGPMRAAIACLKAHLNRIGRNKRGGAQAIGPIERATASQI